MVSKANIKTGYEAHSWHYCIDAYKDPDGENVLNKFKTGEYTGFSLGGNWLSWEACPCCGLKPKVHCFDNGRATACGCWDDKYHHFSIYAESIMSVHNRTDGKNMTEYDSDALRKNWNIWCKTGEVIFEHASKRDDGRW